MIKKARKKHGCPHIRASMSYSRYPNLRELLQADLKRKLKKGITSKDFKNEPCIYQGPSLINGVCPYGEKCRQRCVIYKATCRICSKFYVGQTQRFHRVRINEHIDATIALKKAPNSKTGKKVASTDAFARHFADHIGEDETPSRGLIRPMFTNEILWQGDPVSCTKSFGTLNCTLCMQEKLAILKATKARHPDSGEPLLMNSKQEIYGGCPHRTRFHVWQSTPCSPCGDTRTDDGL